MQVGADVGDLPSTPEEHVIHHSCCSVLAEVLILGPEPPLGLLLCVHGHTCLASLQVLSGLGAQVNEPILASMKNSWEFHSGSWISKSHTQSGPQLQHYGEAEVSVNQGLSSPGCCGLQGKCGQGQGDAGRREENVFSWSRKGQLPLVAESKVCVAHRDFVAGQSRPGRAILGAKVHGIGSSLLNQGQRGTAVSAVIDGSPILHVPCSESSGGLEDSSNGKNT